jgi:hypothetical protein
VIPCNRKYVLDQTISPRYPTTQEMCLLAYTSCIAWNPHQQGTEFTVTANSVTGCLAYLEIQKGKRYMQHNKYYKEYGRIVSSTLRMAENLAAASRQGLVAKPTNYYFCDRFMV